MARFKAATSRGDEIPGADGLAFFNPAWLRAGAAYLRELALEADCIADTIEGKEPELPIGPRLKREAHGVNTRERSPAAPADIHEVTAFLLRRFDFDEVRYWDGGDFPPPGVPDFDAWTREELRELRNKWNKALVGKRIPWRASVDTALDQVQRRDVRIAWFRSGGLVVTRHAGYPESHCVTRVLGVLYSKDSADLPLYKP